MQNRSDFTVTGNIACSSYSDKFLEFFILHLYVLYSEYDCINGETNGNLTNRCIHELCKCDISMVDKSV